MQKSKTRQLQLIQVEILDKFVQVCEHFGLTYYMIGGTLLGAVRHQGFIPWDVDIDVAMMRKDYDKFLETANSFFKENRINLSLATFKNEKDHYSPHAILHSNDVFISNPQLKRFRSHKGVYIDIFPLDDAPSSVEKQTKQKNKIKRIRKILYFKKIVLYDVESNFFKKSIKLLVGNLLKLIPLKSLQKRLERLMKNHDCGGVSKLVGHMASGYDYHRVLFERKIYGKPQLMLFEKKYYFAPFEFDIYLKQYYGNYMNLPSRDEQKQYYESIEKITLIFNEFNNELQNK